MKRITDPVFAHAQAMPAALAACDNSMRLSWAELAASINDTAERLTAAGMLAGDRVALRADDGVSALVHALGVLHAGGIHVPVDRALAAAEVADLVTRLQATWMLDLVDDATGTLARTEQPRVADPLGAGQTAFIRCSSGTTGASKGVLLSHATITARCIAANAALELSPTDRVLWLLPMAYHFAVSIGAYLHFGAAIVFGNALRAKTTAAIAREQAVTLIYASPYHIARLAALPDGENLPETVRCVISTTTALDAEAAQRFQQRHGHGVRQALGIIEVGLPFVSPGSPGEAVGMLGHALPDYEVRLLVDGADADEGELCLRGPGMVDAYLDPWQAREEILTDGWFHSGDHACRLADGSIQLLGRHKDLINVGGVKVFPLEVESVLAAHPAVTAVRVRAMPDPRTGEAVLAEVVLSKAIDEAELRQWCRARLATLKCPARYEILDALPTTASGKVRRYD